MTQIDILQMKEPHVVELEDWLKSEALKKGELIYDEWQKHHFFYNHHTGHAAWDNRYVKGATASVGFGMDLGEDGAPVQGGPTTGGATTGGATTGGGILKNPAQELAELAELDDFDFDISISIF